MWPGGQGRTHIVWQCLIFFLTVQIVGTVVLGRKVAAVTEGKKISYALGYV